MSEVQFVDDLGPWVTMAEKEVAALIASLPADVARQARKVPVFFETDPERTDAYKGLVGLFEGASLRDAEPMSADDLPRITLFIEPLFEDTPDDDAFREEVRVTYLHELGHYLGWDEDEVAARGLQ
ncbi:MAG: metallopeptidase family protein [Verrucomicrobia bacterium]|nr:metallopeptidase family protein [Verrucomicrobiota bacterium]